MKVESKVPFYQSLHINASFIVQIADMISNLVIQILAFIQAFHFSIKLLQISIIFHFCKNKIFIEVKLYVK